jgi:hypothetical protein
MVETLASMIPSREVSKLLGRPRGGQDNIKIDLNAKICNDVGWIHRAKDSD